MQTLVILGTGTDVGKTYVAVQLAKLIANTSVALVSAIKPIETGVHPGAQTDAALLGASSRPVIAADYAYSFAPPISPHLAARASGVPIRASEIAKWVRSRTSDIRNAAATLTHEEHWVIVETAGGVFSPLSDTETNLDLAMSLNPSCWVLVASDKLGVLHAVRATILAMQQLARAPDFVLLSAPAEPDASTGTNRFELERLGWAHVAACVGREQAFDPADEQALLATLRGHFGARQAT